jgi:hypothetical protein
MAEKILLPKDNEVILTFLEKTKNGEYSPIEKSSLSYVRMKETDEFSDTHEQEYSYSLS